MLITIIATLGDPDGGIIRIDVMPFGDKDRVNEPEAAVNGSYNEQVSIFGQLPAAASRCMPTCLGMSLSNFINVDGSSFNNKRR